MTAPDSGNAASPRLSLRISRLAVAETNMKYHAKHTKMTEHEKLTRDEEAKAIMKAFKKLDTEGTGLSWDQFLSKSQMGL